MDSTFCRLDHFLISLDFMLIFQNLIQSILRRSLSDHNTIFLTVDMMKWGPRPFKFFNHWTGEKGFNELIHFTWESYFSNGSISHMF